jgi:superfamily II DNA/RNA helicase
VNELDGKMSFDTLGLAPALTRAVADAGYEQPTEVQQRAIPPALEGRDLRVSSSTGSGKTASFVLPALQRVIAAREAAPKSRQAGPRILVLAPTRELAQQVAKAVATYGRHVPGLRVATVLGGVPYAAQIKALRGPLDVLIATPGRLIDHVQSGKCVLDAVEMLVLDEADRMLDMGFIDDIRFIAGCTPKSRQTVMYSATFAGHVGRLANELLREPLAVEVASHTDTHAHIEQRLHWADHGAHKDALLDHLLAGREIEQAVVFTSTQRDADQLADRLAAIGHRVASLHGGMPQGRRNRVLDGLRRGHLRVLVATDVAARGIDVPTISHVINYGLPMKAEDYVHRIGRTGRAGRAGLAVTLAEARDAGMIHRIQRFTTQAIPVATLPGLEPKRAMPSLRPAHPSRGHRPGAAHRPALAQPRREWAHADAPAHRGDRGDARFDDRRAPRADGAHPQAGWRDAAPQGGRRRDGGAPHGASRHAGIARGADGRPGRPRGEFRLRAGRPAPQRRG